MAAAGLAFGVATAVIFLYPLISGLIKPNPAKATIVALTLGSTGVQNDSGGMGGNIPTIAVYAEYGTEIGRSYGSDKKTWSGSSTNFVSINPNRGMDGR